MHQGPMGFTIIKDGKEYQLECGRLELKKMVSQLFPQIPYDQIVMIDPQTNQVAQDLNKYLTKSQIQVRQQYLIEDLNSIQRENQALKLYVQQYKKEIEKNQQQLQAKNQQIEKLQIQMEQNNQNLINQCSNQEQQQQQVSAELLKLRQQYDQKVDENSELKISCNKLNQDLQNALKELGESQYFNKEQQNNFDKIQKELTEELQQKLYEKEQLLINQNNEYHQNVTNLNMQFTEQMNNCMQYVGQLNQQFSQIEQQNIALTTELEDAKDSSKKSLEAEKKKQKELIEKLEDEKEQYISENRLKMSSTSNDLKVAQKKIQDLEEQIRLLSDKSDQQFQMMQTAQY